MPKYTPLTPELHQFMQAMSRQEDPVLCELREVTQSMPMAIMQIPPEQAHFLQMLIRLMGASKIIELGVFTGYSSLAMAQALPENGKLIGCDVSNEWTDIAKQYWKKAKIDHKIELCIAPAQETLQQLIADGQSSDFDLIFIDADKANYPQYYALGLQLLRRGGLMILDNAFMHGDVINHQEQGAGIRGIRKVLQQAHKDLRVDVSFVPMADGLYCIQKR